MTAPTDPKEHRKNNKRASGPRFTDADIALIRRAAVLEDRAISNLIRVATLSYAKAVIARAT